MKKFLLLFSILLFAQDLTTGRNVACMLSFYETLFSKSVTQQDGGLIKVTSDPESGMLIFIDDINTGKTTPATIENIEPGKHTVKLIGQWFKIQEKTIIVNSNQLHSLDFEMIPNYAELTINSNFDAAIYIDGTRKGTTSWSGRVPEGERVIVVEKDDLISRKQKVLVVRGKNLNVDLMMKPKTGGVEIVTNPTGAMVDINGKLYGITPCHITELLPGEYNLSLSKPRHTGITKRIKVVDGVTTEINVTLLSGKEVLIDTEPTGAKVTYNDSVIGVTPFRKIFDFGSHILKAHKNHLSVVQSIEVTPSSESAYMIPLKVSNDPFEAQMILVSGGTFQMGDTFGDGKKEEQPVRTVTVSKFYISKYEITQQQWESVMGENPSHFESCATCPVERVSWLEVMEFIKKINLLTGKNYRLPTEAEWEFAARGGSFSNGLRYSGSRNINNVAWYNVNSGNKTHPVGQLPANELGLYDMSGNVWEWCSDWMGQYPNRNEVNPSGPEKGELRVVRGGSWFGYIDGNKVSARGADDPANGRSYIGFRLALTP
ncbi:MAG TPA: SUMF1/EgtB/PvdO family nonheme iron enzyme [Tenuifilaceae bacterium]|nr:SUMF1/EgtB/PvdO family nonheme iron enzyme [Tenuifilaceae bacterium]HPE17053.1 SUMF1/EgtB/PvdO family nonheme iron enzyme [Tenuifilaceae bacterium]HPJ44662.1 SUMF1/EgtB/PvdO family nonheme iron enzyme [Tenuifilaceae bacterium]HPQ32926.1 SUMF1/EgtB/PvdO family nonheme iron enzyme [Tenuifilaceae bacterium]HRX66744.1 SUMF1/EgtB/PvdO family nonheme iron enzyme [Tenuifilaceae bacterium]